MLAAVAVTFPLSAGLAEQRLNPGRGEPAPLVRGWCGGQHRQRLSSGQIGPEGGQGGRVILPQQRSQRVHLPHSRPDHRLMGAGGDLEVLGDFTVAGDRAMMRPVQPDNLSRRMRIGGIRLRPRGGVPFSIPGHLHRIDRKHHIAGRQQRLHSRPALGLNSDQHLIRFGGGIEMLRDQLMQGGDPGQSLR